MVGGQTVGQPITELHKGGRIGSVSGSIGFLINFPYHLVKEIADKNGTQIKLHIIGANLQQLRQGPTFIMQ